ncbi:MAG: hypothetical protein IJ001_03690 [Oscillospiraceae bacterium]|nr:hypothetical protein [Oscillospiraceae bacterium]
MLRKVFAVLFCLGVLLGSVSAMAAAETGTIGIMLDREGEVTLYRVGDMTAEGCRLLERYGGLELSFDDILSPDMASWLAQEAEGGTTRESVDCLVTFDGLEQGLYLLVQTTTEVGHYPFSPFLVTIPWDGDQWSIRTRPRTEEGTEESPKTGQGMGLPLAVGLMLVSGMGLMGCAAVERGKSEGK